MSRLLVVDDDADILEALTAVLEDRHEVATAHNGLQALTLLQTQSFDAVVLDLMMPQMDGETLIEHMRQAAIAVPVVLASASADITVLADRLGVEHVSKPYDVSTLEEKLARVSQRSRPNDDSRC
jgi:two-component system response regulator TctD